MVNAKITNAHASIGDANLLLGGIHEARESYAAEPAEPFRLPGLAIAEHRLGNEAAANAAYDRLVSQAGDSALYGDAGLLYVHTDPLVDSLRSDSRFRRLQQELGFD